MANRLRRVGSPSDPTEMLIAADRLLEENDFAAARILYQDAVLGDLSDSRTLQRALANLSIAEAQECLQLRRKIQDQHPGAVAAQLGLIGQLWTLHWYDHVIVRCNELLADSAVSRATELALRQWRFRAATQAAMLPKNLTPEIILDDFLQLWAVATRTEGESRRRLLNQLGQITNLELLPALVGLAAQPDLPDTVRHYTQAKVQELLLLEKLDL